jgi:hypothetical protein
MSFNLAAEAPSGTGLLAGPSMTELNAGNRLSADVETGCDVLLAFASRYGFADKSVSLIERLDGLAPFVKASPQQQSRLGLNGEVGLDGIEDGFAILGIGEHKDEPFPPMGTLLLGPYGTAAETILNPSQGFADAVRQDDANPALWRGSHPSLAVSKACDVCAEFRIRKV